MHHMKISTVRDLRYSFSRIAKWLKAGETIEITYRGKRLARLMHAGLASAASPERPDFESRLERLFPQGLKGTPASLFIIEDRDRT
ncbi:MAG: hypothetical protein H6Q05_1603 [Acidobacteria bacterium]|nr:hypothetical protein [Acidobacteriota bacterium]